MSDNISRFNKTVENYVKYRPGYPDDILKILTKAIQLTSNHVIADVGSGTGLLTKLFLKNGNQVYAVEPNDAMREASKQYLKQFQNVQIIKGTAEKTTLSDTSIDVITVGQAFHWFDHEKTKKEFQRILKDDGWVVLIWNLPSITTPFMKAFDQLLRTYGKDYEKYATQDFDEQLIINFFKPKQVNIKKLTNQQFFNCDGFIGRLRSMSFIPEESDPPFKSMMDDAKKIYQQHEKDEQVCFYYDVKMYFSK